MICDGCYFHVAGIVESEVSGLPLRVERSCAFYANSCPEIGPVEKDQIVYAEACRRGSCTHYMDRTKDVVVRNAL